MKDPKKVEAGRRGGFRKWAKISKRKRSQIMRDVANARHHKGESVGIQPVA